MSGKIHCVMSIFLKEKLKTLQMRCWTPFKGKKAVNYIAANMP